MLAALNLHDYCKFMQDVIQGQRRCITLLVSDHRFAVSFMKPLGMIYERTLSSYCLAERRHICITI